MRSTGMFQLLGVTYRISQVRFGLYEIVRIRDEVLAGSFSHTLGRRLELAPLAVDAVLMKRLVAEAVQTGKTAWMGVRAMSKAKKA
jgi:hypothetical protein